LRRRHTSKIRGSTNERLTAALEWKVNLQRRKSKGKRCNIAEPETK
jgi:hypothetical protein